MHDDLSAPEPPRSTEDPLSPRAPHQAADEAEPTTAAASGPATASEPGAAARDAQNGALVPGATRESRRARESIWIKAREALEANTLPERPATSRDQAALGLGLGLELGLGLANPKPKPSPNQAAALSEEARAVLDSAAALDNEALFLLSEMIGRARARVRVRVRVPKPSPKPKSSLSPSSTPSPDPQPEPHCPGKLASERRAFVSREAWLFYHEVPTLAEYHA